MTDGRHQQLILKINVNFITRYVGMLSQPPEDSILIGRGCGCNLCNEPDVFLQSPDQQDYLPKEGSS